MDGDVSHEKSGLEDDARNTTSVYQHTETASDRSGGKKWRNWRKRKRIKGDPQLSLTPQLSNGVRKYKVRI